MGKNKAGKWIKNIVIFLILHTLLFLYSNPVTYFLSYISADNYIEQKYPGYKILKVRNSYTNGNTMSVTVKFPESIDQHFVICTDNLGRIKYDYYQRDVAEKANVLHRLADIYQEKAEKIISTEAKIANGTYAGANFKNISEEILVIDKEYSREEIEEITLKYGIIKMNMTQGYDETKLIDVARKVKKAFRENNLGFYKIQFSFDKEFEWYLL